MSCNVSHVFPVYFLNSCITLTNVRVLHRHVATIEPLYYTVILSV